MSRPSPMVEGFDYTKAAPITMTVREWRERYPCATYRRTVENGETWYSAMRGDRWRRVAEVYVRVPE